MYVVFQKTCVTIVMTAAKYNLATLLIVEMLSEVGVELHISLILAIANVDKVAHIVAVCEAADELFEYRSLAENTCLDQGGCKALDVGVDPHDYLRVLGAV